MLITRDRQEMHTKFQLKMILRKHRKDVNWINHCSRDVKPESKVKYEYKRTNTSCMKFYL